jgi:hypothetical protein
VRVRFLATRLHRIHHAERALRHIGQQGALAPVIVRFDQLGHLHDLSPAVLAQRRHRQFNPAPISQDRWHARRMERISGGITHNG